MKKDYFKTTLAFLIAIVAFPTPVFATEPCNNLPGAEAIFQNKGTHFIVFGELHGTAESPAAFADLVCMATSSGRKVLVGLELTEGAGPALQAYLQSTGSAGDEQRLLDDSHWAQPVGYQDGRSSEAMLKMVKRLRSLRAAGNNLSITTFQRPIFGQQDTQTPYEKGLAASLMEADARDHFDLVLVLVGNAHAAKAVGRMTFEPMAMHLPQASTLTLNMKYSGGTTWACMQQCGLQTIGHPSGESATRITLDAQLSPGYDGIVDVGTITASLPVNTQ